MKGKTNIGIEISKTEMLAIGTEVEIVDIRYGCDTFYMCIIPSGIRILIEAHKIDITDYTPFADWTTLRREYACKAMQGILGSSPILGECQYVAETAVKYADALINELSKTEQYGSKI